MLGMAQRGKKELYKNIHIGRDQNDNIAFKLIYLAWFDIT